MAPIWRYKALILLSYSLANVFHASALKQLDGKSNELFPKSNRTIKSSVGSTCTSYWDCNINLYCYNGWWADTCTSCTDSSYPCNSYNSIDGECCTSSPPPPSPPPPSPPPPSPPPPSPPPPRPTSTSTQCLTHSSCAWNQYCDKFLDCWSCDEYFYFGGLSDTYNGLTEGCTYLTRPPPPNPPSPSPLPPPPPQSSVSYMNPGDSFSYASGNCPFQTSCTERCVKNGYSLDSVEPIGLQTKIVFSPKSTVLGNCTCYMQTYSGTLSGNTFTGNGFTITTTASTLMLSITSESCSTTFNIDGAPSSPPLTKLSSGISALNGLLGLTSAIIVALVLA